MRVLCVCVLCVSGRCGCVPANVTSTMHLVRVVSHRILTSGLPSGTFVAVSATHAKSRNYHSGAEASLCLSFLPFFLQQPTADERGSMCFVFSWR